MVEKKIVRNPKYHIERTIEEEKEIFRYELKDGRLLQVIRYLVTEKDGKQRYLYKLFIDGKEVERWCLGNWDISIPIDRYKELRIVVRGNYVFEAEVPTSIPDLYGFGLPPVDILKENLVLDISFRNVVRGYETIGSEVEIELDINEFKEFLEEIFEDLIEIYINKKLKVKILRETKDYIEIDDSEFKEYLDKKLEEMLKKPKIKNFVEKYRKLVLEATKGKERSLLYMGIVRFYKNASTKEILYEDFIDRILTYKLGDLTIETQPKYIEYISNYKWEERLIRWDDIIIWYGIDVAKEIMEEFLKDPMIKLLLKLEEKLRESNIEVPEKIGKMVESIRLVKAFIEAAPKDEKELREFIEKYLVEVKKGIFGKKVRWKVKYRGIRERMHGLVFQYYLFMKAKELYEKEYKDKGRFEDLLPALILKIQLEEGLTSYKGIEKKLLLPEPLTRKEKQEEMMWDAIGLVEYTISRIFGKGEKEKGPYVIVTPDGYCVKIASSITNLLSKEYNGKVLIIPGHLTAIGNDIDWLKKNIKEYNDEEDKIKLKMLQERIITPEEYVKIKLGG